MCLREFLSASVRREAEVVGSRSTDEHAVPSDRRGTAPPVRSRGEATQTREEEEGMDCCWERDKVGDKGLSEIRIVEEDKFNRAYQN